MASKFDTSRPKAPIMCEKKPFTSSRTGRTRDVLAEEAEEEEPAPAGDFRWESIGGG